VAAVAAGAVAAPWPPIARGRPGSGSPPGSQPRSGGPAAAAAGAAEPAPDRGRERGDARAEPV